MTNEIKNTTIERIQTQLYQLAAVLPELEEKEQPAGQLWSDVLQEFDRLSKTINQSLNQEAERERLLAETAALYEGSQAIASALSERQIFEALFEQIRRQDPYEISAFRFDLVDNEPVWAELTANWQKRNNPSRSVGTRFYLPETPLARLLTTNEPLFIDNIATDNRLSEAERESFAPTGACSVAILPLVATGQELGAILVYFTNPFAFSKAIQRVWLAVIDQVCVALANHQLLQEAAYHVVQMETAAEVARAASSILDLQELLNSTVALVRDRFDLYYVGVFLVDKAKEWAVLRAGTGEAGRRQLEKGHRLKIGGESMIGWSIHNRQPRIALDVGKDAVHFQNPDLPDTRSEMALPLIYRSEVIGALTIQSEEQAAFSRKDNIFLQTMADQLANAIQNARLFAQAQQEIAERKRAEQALRASESKYRELVQNANSIIFRMNTKGEVAFFNEFAQSFFGYTEDQIIGQNVVGTIVPETDTIGRDLAAMIEDILQDPDRYANNENENMRRNGERVWVSWTNKAILDDDGRIAEILCVGNDVTQRKQAEEIRIRLATALEAVSEFILITDTDGIIQYVNPAFERITGYTRQEAIGQNPRLLKSDKHSQEFYRDMWETLIQGEVWRGDFLNRKKDGTLFNVEETLAPVQDSSGKTINFVAVGRDVTERKQTEEALRKSEATTRALFNAIPDLIIRLDREGTYLDFKAPRDFGTKTSPADRIGKKLYNIVPKEVADQLVHAVRQALETGKTQVLEYQLLRESGLRDREARVVASGEGEALTIVRDITERKRSEQALQDALRRTQLLYNVSEALTTIAQQAPLETVLGEYLRLLKLGRGGIMLLDKASNYNKLQALYVDGKVVEPDLAFPASEDLIAQHLIENPFPLVIEDASNHPLTKHNQEIRDKVESMLFIPMVIRGEVMGILGADATEKGHIFSRDDIEIGKAIADQLTIWLENRQLLEVAQHRSDLLQTAAEVSKAATSSIIDVDQLIDTSVNYIRDQFDFYYVGLFLVDEARKWAVLRAGTGEAGRIQLQKGHRLKIGGESMIGWSVQHRQARIALDVGEDAVHFQNPDLPDTHSEMALPLISRDEVIGALTVQSVERGTFSDEDIVVLQTMADQLANAIANARLFENVALSQETAEVLLQETQALQQLSQALAGTLQVNEILNLFFQACTQDIGFEYVIFSLVDKYQHRVKAIDGIGVIESQIKRANHSLDSNDIMADIIRTGQTEVITGWDDRFDRENYEAGGQADWVKVFIPIKLRQENIGLVEAGLHKNIRADIEDSHLRLLRAFIDQTALALDNAQRYEASRRAARREALIKEIIAKVRASTDLDVILQTTVKEVGDAIGGRRSFVHMISPTNGETGDNE